MRSKARRDVADFIFSSGVDADREIACAEAVDRAGQAAERRSEIRGQRAAEDRDGHEEQTVVGQHAP